MLIATAQDRPDIWLRAAELDADVWPEYNTHGDVGSCGGLVCVGYSNGWVKCYGHPIPQCINICI